jgi:hypothetical protein
VANTIFALVTIAWLLALAWGARRQGPRTRRRLEALAGRLGGTIRGDDPYAGAGVTVEGALDGRRVILRVRAEDGLRFESEVEAPHPPCDLAVEHPDALVDVVNHALFGAKDRRVRGLKLQSLDEPAATRLLHGPAGDLLVELLAPNGRVTIREGRVRHARPSGLRDEVEDLLRELRLLARIGAALEPAPEPSRRTRLRFAWIRGDLLCPFCRDDLDPRADDAQACDACATVHHRECLEQAGGCTIFGCRGGPTRPAERES